MSIISEESETDDDDQLDEEFILCNDNTNHQQQDHSSTNLSVENCLGDLNSFKEVRISSFLLHFFNVPYFLSTDR